MEKWQIILYAVATFLAIRSLLTLMEQHRQEMKKKLPAQTNPAPPIATDGSKTAAASTKAAS